MPYIKYYAKKEDIILLYIGYHNTPQENTTQVILAQSLVWWRVVLVAVAHRNLP